MRPTLYEDHPSSSLGYDDAFSWMAYLQSDGSAVITHAHVRLGQLDVPAATGIALTRAGGSL